MNEFAANTDKRILKDMERFVMSKAIGFTYLYLFKMTDKVRASLKADFSKIKYGPSYRPAGYPTGVQAFEDLWAVNTTVPPG